MADSDPSARVMNAWLAVNPEPPFLTKEWAQWAQQSVKLEAMLDCGALESAVIQFLVPEGCDWYVTSCGEDNTPSATITSPLDHDEDGGCKDFAAHGLSSAEALLNACLASRPQQGGRA